MNIVKLIIEQQKKMLSEYNGGLKYGHDYNILKAILEHIKDERLVENLIDSLEDKSLIPDDRSFAEKYKL